MTYIVARKVFTRRHHLFITPAHTALLVVRPLQSGDQRPHIVTQMHRIFAGRLLTPSPPRIAKRVDVGRPKVQPRPSRIAERARLGADHGRHLRHEVVVKCRPERDGLREARRGPKVRVVLRVEGDTGRHGHAMQAFGPPLVGGKAEPRDAGGRRDGGIDFFLDGKQGEEATGTGGGT